MTIAAAPNRYDHLTCPYTTPSMKVLNTFNTSSRSMITILTNIMFCVCIRVCSHYSDIKKIVNG